MNLTDLIKEYVNKDYSELVSIATEAFGNVVVAFDKLSDGSTDSQFATMAFIGTALAADGKFTPLEYRFLCDLLGDMKAESAVEFVKAHFSDECLKLTDKLFDVADNGLKTDLLTLVLCITAVDETVSVEETKYIVRLLENK